MIERLRVWIAAKRSKRKIVKEVDPEPEPDLPFFLNTEKQLLPISSAGIETQDASIFSKLPPEIRREILIKAFGARRVHMDLFYGHPYISTLGDNGHPQGAHYNGVYDIRKPKCWQWRGCVCHRTLSPYVQSRADNYAKIWPTDDGSGDPYSPYPSWNLGEERSRLWESDEPGDDTCFKGFAYQCGTYKFGEETIEDSSVCWIGAMGWLLTCRQAYIEGVEVLYSTNTIFISSEALLTRLPRSIPTPPRLLFLRSLEIVWNLETVDLPRGLALHRPNKKAIHQGRLKQILEIILDSLFEARRLHLALVLRTAFGEQFYLDNTLHLLDAFAESLCRLKTLKVPLQVSITSTVYKQLYKQAKRVAINKTVVKPDVEFQFWRFINGKCALAPRDPEVYCKIDGATVETGYWIVRGGKDDDTAHQGQPSGY